MEHHQLKAPSEHVEWDDEVTSLGRRVRRGGVARWIVQFRIDGRMRKRVIGDGRRLSRDDARRAAIIAMERMQKDQDTEPMAKAISLFVTIAEFGEGYLRDMALRWKETTRTGHRNAVLSAINPVLGSTRVTDLTREGVVAWRDGQTGGEGTIDRSQAALSGMMRHAELLGIRASGLYPSKGLRRRRSGFEATYLDANGFRKLAKAFKRIGKAYPVE